MKKNKKALKAAKTIKKYCRSIPAGCEKCIFNIIFFNGGFCCMLNDPNHLPETWELKKIKE